MRAAFRKFPRSWLVHAIIVAIAILIGLVIALSARPTHGVSFGRFCRTVDAGLAACHIGTAQHG